LAGITKQLRVDYPDRALDWLAELEWTKPEEVPLDKIDYGDSIFERVRTTEAKKVALFKKRIAAGWRKPVILVKRPGMPLLKAIDGHTRLTAYRLLDDKPPATAWVGIAKTKKGPWDSFHKQQLQAAGIWNQVLELGELYTISSSYDGQRVTTLPQPKRKKKKRRKIAPAIGNVGTQLDRLTAAKKDPAYYSPPTNVTVLSAQTARLVATPDPRGKPGGPGLYNVKGLGHSNYFQHIVKALIRSGKPPGIAYAIAWGAIRRWARGGGNVTPEVRAAARAALVEEKAKGALAKAKK
jgi:hypothetical protein